MIRAAQGQERAGGGDHRLGGEDLQDLCSQVGTGAVGTNNFLNMMKCVRTSSFVTMIVKLQRSWRTGSEEDDTERTRGEMFFSNHLKKKSSCFADQVSQHVEEKVLALQISLRELQTGVEGLGPLQTGGQ